MNCPDCDALLSIPSDVINGEIIKCQDCGINWEYNNGLLKKAEEIEEDWGE